MARPPATDALWQFSLALYPKVQPICLQWQDSFGLNVNLLLLLCYLEQRQLSLSGSQLEQLAATLNTFSQQFTQPLRALRRSSSKANLSVTQQQQLKQSLLAAELSLEQLEQQLLLEYCPALSQSAQPLIERYLSQLQADTPALARQILDLRQAVTQLR
ncbi:MAG: TIGR02444 family protein [Rheinheimera sp.]|uniref:TIGR02444 family protein n=1 Tax=Arsukibacterium sp. UBA3155 TaxID=1946058 RepID=UPI000C937004|nr:TIGR02444 family protein [Arsukibacterium sp. UBA3155]MAD76542.1 TIGR02444 family protein [Rheinheimera sp.]|tara:strand:- start:194397 stop:194873 length:477 start_codon:yes stop_codon:yes gene_type:complete